MRSKKLIFLVGLFLIFFLNGVEADSCSIQSSCAPENTIMKLSSATNAHGEFYFQTNYDFYLCCDFTGIRFSNGTNGEVVGLSSLTNAHAQVPGLTSYGNSVYFGDLVCVDSADSCLSEYPLQFLSLSSTTNAHLGSFNTYSTKICCKHAEGGPGEQCAIAGGACEFIPCNILSEDDLGQKDCGLLKTCCADKSCTPNYYSSCYDNDVYWYDSCDVRGEKREECGILGCSNSTCNVNDECQFTFSEWGSLEVSEGTNVNLIVGGTNCDGKNVNFEVFENELIGRNPAITNPVNVVFNGASATGTWIAEYIDDGIGQGNPEYVFKASLVDTPSIVIDDSGELEVLLRIPNPCIGIDRCSDYSVENECTDDDCSVAYGDVQEKYPLVTCGEGGVICGCEWVSDNCRSYFTGNDSFIGTCSYIESTDDDCDDGFFSYDWIATWTWGEGNGWDSLLEALTNGPYGSVEADYVSDEGRYYYDPFREYNDCQNGNTLVECPVSIQVGFFGVWNFIIAIIILVGFYFLREMKYKKK